jgi:hypothetical protein
MSRARTAAAAITASGVPPIPISTFHLARGSCRQDGPCHVTVGVQRDPGADLADLPNQALVARLVEDEDGEIANAAVAANTAN